MARKTRKFEEVKNKTIEDTVEKPVVETVTDEIIADEIPVVEQVIEKPEITVETKTHKPKATKKTTKGQNLADFLF